VTVRVQVVFEADTMEDIAVAVRQWLDTSPAAGRAAASTEASRRELELREVLGAIRGTDSRRFVRELAEAAVKGEGLPFDADLKARYGRPTGAGFGGIVGGPNKIMRRTAHRDLISRDALADGYRMDLRDAQIVIDTWTPDTLGLRKRGSGIRT
jgi:hypothetical protein